MSSQSLDLQKPLGASAEDYLEAIYILSQEDNLQSGVHSVDVASRLGVTKSSVSRMIATLKDAGLVDQQPYGSITLTSAGQASAEEILATHKTLYTFLVSVLGVTPDVADEEACTMEHALSRDTQHKWAQFMREYGFLSN